MLIKIYRVENSVNNKIYIGSTIQKLKCRMAQHKVSANRGYQSLLYNEMRKIGINNFSMIQINEIEVNDLDQARFEEQQEINKYSQDILLNEQRAIDNNEVRRLYMKNYYQQNKEKQKDYQRKYYNDNYLNSSS